MKGSKLLAFSCLLFTEFFLQSPVALSQSSPMPGLIGAAKKEGGIVWYNVISLEHSKVMMERFQKKYPFIKLELVRSGTGPLLNRILNETRAGRHSWDVVTGSAEMYLPLVERKLIAPYSSPETKMYDNDMKDKEGYWTTLYANPIVLGFNTRLVRKEEAPRTYEDLLDPKWRGGKISIDTEGFALLSGLIEAWGMEKAVAYFRKLAAKDPVLKRGNTERVQLATAGEYPLVIAFAAQVEGMVQKKAPMDWVPLEPVVVRLNPIMMAANAPHPNSAKLFIDFALSKEGQEIIRDSFRIPVRNDVDPNPSRLLRGYKRVIETPESYVSFPETVKLYQEIFKLR